MKDNWPSLWNNYKEETINRQNYDIHEDLNNIDKIKNYPVQKIIFRRTFDNLSHNFYNIS